MPRYLYKCEHCDIRIDAWHGMSEEERIKDCDACGSRNSIVRLPSNFIVDNESGEHKAGDLVKKAIADFSEDLRQEKQTLKSEYYEDDN